MSTGVAWECPSCTLLNADPASQVCDLCGAPRPTGSSSSISAATSAAAVTRMSMKIASGMQDDKRYSVITDDAGSHMSLGAILRAGPEAFQRELDEKRKLEKMGGVKGVFGVPLVSPCPQILCDCVAYVLANGMSTEGVFRIPGQQDVVDFLRSEYEKYSSEGKDILGMHKGKFDIHDIATLFKTYFRQLPDPLVCFFLYS